MSYASISTYAELQESGNLTIGNENVWAYLKAMPDGCGTIYNVIHFIQEARGITFRDAVLANRFAQPIIRALSEGCKKGYIEANKIATNQDTGYLNTVYHWLDTPVAPKENNGYKRRYEALKAEFEAYKATKEKQLQDAIDTLAKLDYTIAQLKEQIK